MKCMPGSVAFCVFWWLAGGATAAFAKSYGPLAQDLLYRPSPISGGIKWAFTMTGLLVAAGAALALARRVKRGISTGKRSETMIRLLKKWMRRVARIRAALAGLAVSLAVVAATPALAKKLSEVATAAGQEIAGSMVLVSWVLYALAVLVGGWAILKIKSNWEHRSREGMGLPAVGIVVAICLAVAPSLIGAGVESLDIGGQQLERPKLGTP